MYECCVDSKGANALVINYSKPFKATLVYCGCGTVYPENYGTPEKLYNIISTNVCSKVIGDVEHLNFLHFDYYRI